MTLFPYNYRALDGWHDGASTSRRRARQSAAALARKTGQTVELLEPDGAWLIVPVTMRRARWERVESERSAAA